MASLSHNNILTGTNQLYIYYNEILYLISSESPFIQAAIILLKCCYFQPKEQKYAAQPWEEENAEASTLGKLYNGIRKFNFHVEKNGY